MRCLTTDECVRWCETSGQKTRHVDVYGWDLPDVPRSSQDISVSEAALLSGESIELAKAVIEFGATASELLVWITDWEINSSEGSLMPLLDAVRATHGERRFLKQAPGHLFAGTSKDGAVEVLSLALLFGWDAYVLGNAKGVFVCSHDGWRTFRGVDREFHGAIAERFKRWT